MFFSFGNVRCLSGCHFFHWPASFIERRMESFSFEGMPAIDRRDFLWKIDNSGLSFDSLKCCLPFLNLPDKIEQFLS